MKDLYVYMLKKRDIEEFIMEDVVCKKNGDIIRREDNYYYSKHGYGRFRCGRSGTENKNKLDIFTFGCYGENDWFVKYISYEEQTDLIKLKSEMIKAFQEFAKDRCKDKLEKIDKEFEAYKIEMIKKREKCVQDRDNLVDLSLKKFL